MLGAEENALHIDALHKIPLCLRDFMGGLTRAGDAGVIDQNIDATELCGDGFQHAGDLRLTRHIAMPIFHVSVLGLQFPF